MSEWKNVCFECGDKKREIRDLKVRVADCEGAIERREQFIAQANSERDSALDAEVVAWAEVDRLRALLSELFLAFPPVQSKEQCDLMKRVSREIEGRRGA